MSQDQAAPARQRARGQLLFASGAVLLAAADTYVVVLALTAMMFDLGISIDQLQKATPIVSGFLVGYVAVLPLLGRLSDLYGRQPVFFGCLIAFALGSLITASGTSLAMVVIGRTLQGLGGGGLVPVTLALVADLWPAERRGTPLGVVAGVQEFGSVLGPLYGAAILAVTSWRAIFWVNLPLAAILGLGLALSRPAGSMSEVPPRGHSDFIGIGLLLLLIITAGAAIIAPDALTQNVVIGALYGPMGGVALLTPIAIVAAVSLAAFVVWEALEVGGRRPLLRIRGLPDLLRRADWLGAVLLSVVLTAIVVAFVAADPSQQVISDAAVWLLPLALAAAVGFVIHERRATAPLIEFTAFRDRAAGGAMACNLFVGAGLVAALIDVPIFARTTTYHDSQLQAALVLLRLLAAVPVGAVIGGLLCERIGYRLLTGGAMLLSAAMFMAMSRWNFAALEDPLFGVHWLHTSDFALATCGLGFGLAIAPVNAAMLAAVKASWSGLAAALVVVARSVGMLVGLSVLTAIGLRQFHEVARALPSPASLCPSTPTLCAQYDALSRDAVIAELHVIFIGAAIACTVAAAIAAATLHHNNGVKRPLGALLGGA